MDETNSKMESKVLPRTDLRTGCPGAAKLRGCTDLILEATKTILGDDHDHASVFNYGYEGGDDDFRQQLSQFLSHEYDDNVKKENLMMTAGATHGFHVALTLLVSNNSPVFVVDPTYFNATFMVQSDFQRAMVPVPSDSEGPLIDEFEEIIKAHRTDTDASADSTKRFPYWAAAYVIPTFNNPTGLSYTPERCKMLVSLARKYNIMLLADDVYNLIYYTDLKDAPKRLFAYDTPSDPDYGIGHVLSNSTFSKVLAPGLRVGWIEGPKDIIHKMTWSYVSSSGGAFSHYVGKLVTELLRNGQQQKHVAWLRESFKGNMDILWHTLNQYLPAGCNYQLPKGGFFIWVGLLPDTDGEELLAFCQEKYNLIFIPGERASPTHKFKNYVRLCATYLERDALEIGVKLFCEAYKDFLDNKKK